MVMKWLLAWAVVSVLFVVVVGNLPVMIETVETIRTDPFEETGLNCTTGAGSDSCSVVLASEHAFGVIQGGGTVTETSPGSADRTDASELAGDRRTVTVSGLSAATSYVFTIEYDVVVVEGALGTVLTWSPWVVLLSLIGSMCAGLIAGVVRLFS